MELIIGVLAVLTIVEFIAIIILGRKIRKLRNNTVLFGSNKTTEDTERNNKYERVKQRSGEKAIILNENNASKEGNELLRTILTSSVNQDPYLVAKVIVDALVNDTDYDLNYVTLLSYNKDTNDVSVLYSNVRKSFLPTLVRQSNDYLQSIKDSENHVAKIEQNNDGFLAYPTAAERRIRFSYFIPLSYDKSIIGALLIEKQNLRKAEQLSLDFFKLIVSNISVVLNNLVLLRKVVESVNIDALTKVYNRHYFNVFIGEKFKTGVQFAFVMCDIDFFKKVNDTYGHLAGDEVLKGVAKCLQYSVRNHSDIVFRYGGEEFCLYLEIDTVEILIKKLESIRKTIEDAVFPFEGVNIKVTLSLGATLALPSDKDISAIIARADAGVYAAKEAGRNRVIYNK